MKVRPFWRMLGSSWLLAIGLASAPGCLSCCHPLTAPEGEPAEHCQALPPQCRRHVAVFVLNGIDPLGCSNLSGLEVHLHKLGFTQTYFGQCYHAPWFAHVIRHLHHDEPDTRFVLIGFDVGANAARWTAEMVQAAHVPIDVLVYLDGCLVSNGPDGKPANVGQVINVVAGCGKSLDGAEQVDTPGVCHYGAPTHPAALCRLSQALAEVAAQVPVAPQPEPVPVLVPLLGAPNAPLIPDETAPTPRPVPPQETTERDEWDFLKPSEQLRTLREEVQPTSTLPADLRP